MIDENQALSLNRAWTAVIDSSENTWSPVRDSSHTIPPRYSGRELCSTPSLAIDDAGVGQVAVRPGVNRISGLARAVGDAPGPSTNAGARMSLFGPHEAATGRRVHD